MKKCQNCLSILKSSKGFTVFELILVIVLIGILTGIGMVRFAELKNSAQSAACVTNQQSLNTAQRMYYVMHAVDGGDGEYATVIDDLASYLRSDKLPECPVGGEYEISPKGVVFCSIPTHIPGN